MERPNRYRPEETVKEGFDWLKVSIFTLLPVEIHSTPFTKALFPQSLPQRITGSKPKRLIYENWARMFTPVKLCHATGPV